MGRKRLGKPAGAIIPEGATKQLDTGTPTSERLIRAEGHVRQTGSDRSHRRYHMMDDNLGRLALQKLITEQQYKALQRYAVHWYAGGMAGALSSFDLDRIRAINPGVLGGLARNERELTHKRLYQDARLSIGAERARIADHVACYDGSLVSAGTLLGYASPFRGRQAAARILIEAADWLDRFWQVIDRERYNDKSRKAVC